MTKKLILCLAGGLGNQLFQYFFGFSASKETNREFIIDNKTGFKTDYVFKRTFEIPLVDETKIKSHTKNFIFLRLVKKIFKINYFKLFNNIYISEEKLLEDKSFLVKNDTIKNIFILGNFQDENYFKKNKFEIIKTIRNNTSRKDIQVFCEGILNLKFFLNKKSNESFYILKEENDFHPILKSRIFSQYMLMKDADIISKLNNYYQKNQVNGFIPIEYLFEINFTSILTRNFEVMKWIIEKINPETNYTFFYKYEHYSNYLFMKLIYYTKMDDHEKIATFDKYLTIQRFKSYEEMALLYHNIYKFKWTNDVKYLDNYMKIAKKLNPEFFTKKYFFDYFN